MGRTTCSVGRVRTISLSLISLALTSAALTVAGCAGPSVRQKGDVVTVTNGKDTVIIRKDGDNCVIEAKEASTGARAVIVARPDGTATVKATGAEGEATIEAGPGDKVAITAKDTAASKDQK